MLQSGCTTSINHFTGKQNNPSKQKAAEKLSRHTKEEPGDCVRVCVCACMRVSADGYVFAIEGDIQMKKEKKKSDYKVARGTARDCSWWERADSRGRGKE